jgi:hypothetical protein
MIVHVHDVADNIRVALGLYRKRVLAALDKLTLKELLKKKNAYLYSTRVNDPRQFLMEIVDARCSSSEETIFGKTFEGIVRAVYALQKGIDPQSAAEGLDIEIVRGDKRLNISAKSGGSWSNSSSAAGQKAFFKAAKKRLGKEDGREVLSVMFIAYGNSAKVDGLDYADLKLMGQAAWFVLSGDPNFYTDMVPLFNEEADFFADSLRAAKNTKVEQLLLEFCKQYVYTGDDGILRVAWDKLVQLQCANHTRIENAKYRDITKDFDIQVPNDDAADR